MNLRLTINNYSKQFGISFQITPFMILLRTLEQVSCFQNSPYIIWYFSLILPSFWRSINSCTNRICSVQLCEEWRILLYRALALWLRSKDNYLQLGRLRALLTLLICGKTMRCDTHTHDQCVCMWLLSPCDPPLGNYFSCLCTGEYEWIHVKLTFWGVLLRKFRPG